MAYTYSEVLLSYKNDELLPFAIVLMDLEGIVLSEMSGRKKQILYVFTYMWNLKKKNKTHSKSKTDSQIQN